MFYQARKFNRDISGWITDKVTSMAKMFDGCSKLKSNLSKWNVGRVANFERTFAAFCNSDHNCADVIHSLQKWDTSSATNMKQMFSKTNDANLDFVLGAWNVSKVTNMEAMFEESYKAAWRKDGEQDIGDWDVSSVTNMKKMFYRVLGDFSPQIEKWNTGKVKDMTQMFHTVYKFNQPIGSWDVGSVTTFFGMFECSNW